MSRELLRVPASLHRYFWDQDQNWLEEAHPSDVIATRLLQAGGWDAVQWLRSALGDAEIRRILTRRAGRGIAPARLRFWELVLDLPPALATAWIERERASLWHQRTRS